jgi:hypothetical protein
MRLRPSLSDAVRKAFLALALWFRGEPFPMASGAVPNYVPQTRHHAGTEVIFNVPVKTR